MIDGSEIKELEIPALYCCGSFPYLFCDRCHRLPNKAPADWLSCVVMVEGCLCALFGVDFVPGRTATAA